MGMSEIVKILKEENRTRRTPEPPVLENTFCVEERKKEEKKWGRVDKKENKDSVRQQRKLQLKRTPKVKRRTKWSVSSEAG